MKGFAGTLILVSHDRWFVERLANRIVEITPHGVRDYRGTYEEYVRHCGDDHLDVEMVVERGKGGRRGGGGRDEAEARGNGGRRRDGGGPTRGSGGPRRRRGGRNAWQRRQLEARVEEVAAGIEAAEGRVGEIDAAFARATFYESAGRAEVAALGAERRELVAEIERLVGVWEGLEGELEG